MSAIKERIKSLQSKIKSDNKSNFVGKVITSSKNRQLMDEMEYWQANNDKSPTDKPWGKQQ